ncbi:hypothetical protein ebA567 [Aromatoleum aromaticum EbN1]|uniref:Uncharacterized protein n=1 Tax=Aromatoleum aromaticum (strain DSM 19018 / LMG 30748 / EbN1) TaxID=76114 RepID=Q5P8E2_AROAE|nr:hypothetical protein ebA567 [Aromatoleum aromaticum EbN1]
MTFITKMLSLHNHPFGIVVKRLDLGSLRRGIAPKRSRHAYDISMSSAYPTTAFHHFFSVTLLRSQQVGRHRRPIYSSQ